MKIVIFGLTLSSSWGNGHATLWRGLCRALGRLGHEVVFFERDVPYYAAHRDLVSLDQGRLELFGSWEDVRPRAQRELADADVGLITSYCPDAAGAAELLLASGALRVFYDLDTPVTLAAVRAGETVAYLLGGSLAPYDLVLSYTGGAALTELTERLGARAVAPLYGSVDTERHRPVPPRPELHADLSYLGTYAADRQETLETLFVQPARRLPDHRFLIGGALYPPHFPWADNIFFVRHVEPGRHPEFFASSRFTLNVTRASMKQMGHCPSGRLFEAAACGAPLITDAWDGLAAFFEPGSEIVVAENANEVVAALGMDEAERLRLAARARERTLACHTAEMRARELERLLENSCTRRPAPAASLVEDQ